MVLFHLILHKQQSQNNKINITYDDYHHLQWLLYMISISPSYVESCATSAFSEYIAITLCLSENLHLVLFLQIMIYFKLTTSYDVIMSLVILVP